MSSQRIFSQAISRLDSRQTELAINTAVVQLVQLDRLRLLVHRKHQACYNRMGTDQAWTSIYRTHEMATIA